MKWLLFFLACFTGNRIHGQAVKIGIIDFFGNRSVSQKLLLEKLSFREGDSLSVEQVELRQKNSVEQLKSTPGIKNVSMDFVCCDDKSRQYMLFVGVDEGDLAQTNYRAVPGSAIQVPPAVAADYKAFDSALQLAFQRGAFTEDHSQGHALSNDSGVRYWQYRFIDDADKNFRQLAQVLHNASDASQRAIAAHVIAYTSNRKAVIPELLLAVSDPDEIVRNNATRALGVLASYMQRNNKEGLSIPAGPFIGMINSLVWTDRNKGAMVLMSLTENRDKQLLNELKKEALPALTEMARWKNPSHAYSSQIMLGRIAGLPDDEFNEAFFSGNQQAFVKKALDLINGSR